MLKEHTDTDTCMHICILTDNYTVKPVLSGTQKGEHSAILLTFIKLPFFIKIFVLSSLEWLLKAGFTVLTTYMYFLLSGVRRLAVR